MEIKKYSGKIVDLIGNQIFKGEITVTEGRISSIIEKENVDDCYIAPGLVDAHVHIESSMLTPSEFAREAVKHGTVAVVSDPHEIGNVLGIDGIRFMIDNSKKVPLKFNFGAPSCVPVTNFETSGAALGVNEVNKLLALAEIGHLAEVANYPGVINDDPEVYKKIALAKQAGKPIDGHAPGVSGTDLEKYISAGISTDHECFTLEEAIEKIRLGMKILIREGSAAKNFDTLHSLLQSHPDKVMFCSDDIHPDDLIKGHINILVRRALDKGHDLLPVLKACSYNPIKHYKLEAGLLQTGDCADFIIFNNPGQFEIQQVYINGIKVSDHGVSLINSAKETPLNNFKAKKISTADIEVLPLSSYMRVIDIIPGELITGQSIQKVKLSEGKVISDTENDILKIVMLNRYKTAKPSIAFIKNSGIKKGSIASSIVHDSHNIISLGVSDLDITEAINAVIDAGGGISASRDGNTLVLPLPFGGLMDNRSAEEIALDYAKLEAEARAMGSSLKAPFMTLAFMGLLVIPELKLSDMGLFDGQKFNFVDLFTEYSL